MAWQIASACAQGGLGDVGKVGAAVVGAAVLMWVRRSESVPVWMGGGCVFGGGRREGLQVTEVAGLYAQAGQRVAAEVPAEEGYAPRTL